MDGLGEGGNRYGTGSLRLRSSRRCGRGHEQEQFLFRADNGCIIQSIPGHQIRQVKRHTVQRSTRVFRRSGPYGSSCRPLQG